MTPFKVKRIKTTLDDYLYTSDDKIIEGEIEEGKIYEEARVTANDGELGEQFLREFQDNEKSPHYSDHLAKTFNGRGYTQHPEYRLDAGRKFND